MEGEARVLDRRWRVREKMEGDRALQRVIGFKMCLRKIKEKKMKGLPKKKIKDKRPMAACIKRGRSSIQKKNADIAVKNAALDLG